MATMDLAADESLRELVDIASPYWAAEAEVVRTYFSRPRTKESDIRWLRAQCYKEFFGALDGDPGGLVWGPINRLLAIYESLLKQGQHRREFLHVAEELYEEFHHYSVLADILEELEGRPVPPAELRPCPEDAKLVELRAGFYREDGDLGRYACKFTEGGGCGMFLAGMQVSGGELEAKIAQAFKTIYDDEVDHMQSGAARVRQVAKSEADWQRAKHIVREVSRQRVRMRNDMFGFPLSDQRLAEIEQGKIEPLNRDILVGAA